MFTDTSSHTHITTISLTISFQSLLRLRMLLNLYRQQPLDIFTWMLHGLLDPSAAKSELTQDTVAPPSRARSARMALLSTQLAQAENCPSPTLFQSMALLFLASLKARLTQAQSNPPHLLCELLLRQRKPGRPQQNTLGPI